MNSSCFHSCPGSYLTQAPTSDVDGSRCFTLGFNVVILVAGSHEF